jgi:hypothetical protein
LHILHYGFDGKYLPIGFDVLFIKDIKNMARFLVFWLIACSTKRYQLKSEPCYDVKVATVVASIMACSRSPTPCMDEVRFLR